jgi:5-oxoprolinase (ATP-hydrolysing) subunit A
MTIDLNCDMGELATVPEPQIMPFITSANIACGAHAGDEEMMERTLRLAAKHGVACGAHPGYPDRANFGRDEMALSPEKIEQTVFEQVTTLAQVAAHIGCDVVHVKPHGALYNVAVHRREVAQAIADGVARWRRDVVLVGLAGSMMLDIWRHDGFTIAAEAFADRAYEPDGTLRSRKLPGAMITDPGAAAAQAVEIARSGKAQTICIHSDTAGAVTILRAVRDALERANIDVKPL